MALITSGCVPLQATVATFVGRDSISVDMAEPTSTVELLVAQRPAGQARSNTPWLLMYIALVVVAAGSWLWFGLTRPLTAAAQPFTAAPNNRTVDSDDKLIHTDEEAVLVSHGLQPQFLLRTLPQL